jgi:hypothetical protein
MIPKQKHLGMVHSRVIAWPFLDIDATYTYDENNNLTTVEIIGLGKTKTITFTYTDGNLTGKTTIIT